MGRMMLLAAGLATVLACAPAMAQPEAREPMGREAYLAVQKQRFIEMDPDKDGVVTRDEMSARMTERMDRAAPARLIDALFGRLDGNGDGKASIAEAEAAAAARFRKLDTNRDGLLDDDERRAGMERMRVRMPQKD